MSGRRLAMLVVVSAVASLGAPGGSAMAAEGRGIPVGDLPPFPDLSSDTEKVAEATVYGAASTEEEVVVGAAKREQSLGTVASAVTVITADQLRRFGYRSLAEALRGVAGIYIVDDRAVERVGIRGVQILGDANTHILVLIDGSPLNEPWSQFVDASTALPVNLDDVSRVEVIRGPVSSIYGTNAFFGIINIVSLEADKAPRAYGRTTVNSYGSFGANAAFGVGSVDRQVRGALTFAHRFGESVNYPDFMGLGGETDADGMQAFAGSLALNFDRLFAQIRGYDRVRDLPGAPFDTVIGSDGNENRDQQILAEVGYTQDIGERVTVAGRAYVDRYRFTGHRTYGEDRVFETTGDSLWYGGEVRGLADVLEQKGLLAITAGVSVEATQTTSKSEFAQFPDGEVAPGLVEVDKDFTIAGIYAEATSEPLPWLGFTIGLRSDQNSEFTNELSPRAALFLHRGDEYGLKLLYAEGFRNPSIFEAFYTDGQYFSPALGMGGESELRPENIASYEVVLYGRPLPGVKVRLSAWEWRMDDVLAKDEYFDGNLNRRQIYFFNTSSLVSRGTEVEAAYRDVAGRLGYLNATLAFTAPNCLGNDSLFGNPFLDKDIDAGNCDDTENSPALVMQAGVSSQLLFDLLHASTELYFVSSRGTQDPSQEVDPYLGWNMTAYFPDIRDLKGLDLTVGARNLLGREEVPAQSDYNRTVLGRQGVLPVLVVPGPGRELFARLGYRF